jgi:hypothetical protein
MSNRRCYRSRRRRAYRSPNRRHRRAPNRNRRRVLPSPNRAPSVINPPALVPRVPCQCQSSRSRRRRASRCRPTSRRVGPRSNSIPHGAMRKPPFGRLRSCSGRREAHSVGAQARGTPPRLRHGHRRWTQWTLRHPRCRTRCRTRYHPRYRPPTRKSARSCPGQARAQRTRARGSFLSVPRVHPISPPELSEISARSRVHPISLSSLATLSVAFGIRCRGS